MNAAEMNTGSERDTLRRLFDAAVHAADPAAVIAPHLPDPPPGRTLVLAAGKAAASMAQAVEQHWPGDISDLTGLAVTRYGHGMDCARIEIIEAGHPLPDAAGHAAAQRFLALAHSLTANDLLICLMSGGASALLVEPAVGLSLDDKQAVSRALLHSGAPIDEMNCVRKHLSAIKGGRLAAAAHPARVVTLAISDVPGDDPAVIGSGPTVGDPTTCADALAIAARRGIALPATATSALAAGAWESIKPDDPVLANGIFEMIARPADAQTAAAETAREAGLAPTLLGDDLEGEARDVATDHARLALAAGPGVILSGGETTVRVDAAAKPPGRGGRNCEYLLALAIALDGAPGIHALACDTDGIDGTEDAAGAFIGPDTLTRAAALGLDAHAVLHGHDSYTFFDRLGDLVVTGPTRTNVNDFRAILVSGPIGGSAV
jgi:glycerate 2-kinase